MRIDLSTLTTERLAIEWPGVHGPQRVVFAGATGLLGGFETLHPGYRVSNAKCAQMGVEMLSLRFGSTVIELAHGGQLQEVAADLAKTSTLSLAISARTLRTSQLRLTIGSTVVSGSLEGEGVQLRMQAGEGELVATSCFVRGVKLESGVRAVASEAISVRALSVRWGAGGLSVRAERLGSTAIDLNHPQMSGKLFDVGVDGLSVERRSVQVEQAQVQRAAIEVTMPPPADPPQASEVPPGDGEQRPTRPSMFDLRMLDGLSGNLDVDVALELSGVPIIGRRRATHKLRVPVMDGTIDYRELERDLASLEDSLLDFSVRDGALVLELGLPLIIPRGHGKPLLIWPLNPEDLALAEARRVRLSVLPAFQTAGDGDSSEERDRPSKFQLRTMSFQDIDAALSLSPSPPAQDASIRTLSFTRLHLTGEVHHEAGPPDPEGKVSVELEGLAVALANLVTGHRSVSATLSLAALRGAQIEFRDLRPAALRGELESLVLSKLALKTV